ncbi:MAG: DUF4386 domain-containing protein [Planctomycetes bacterium]|nr:DUF4386 domain-containing protein [Planctomycetota bacterium]
MKSPMASPPVGYARLAGLAYLLVIILGVASVGGVDSRLIITEDDAATARNILAHETLFRVGLVSGLILYAGVLVLSWALYVVLRPVSKHLSLLALIFRCAEGVLGAATGMFGLAVLAALEHEGPDAHALVGTLLEARTATLDFVLVFVGVGGAVFCYLFLVSKLIPRVLAAWGIVTYASMFGLGLLSILWADHPSIIEITLYGAGTLFEVSVGLWLLVKAIDVRKWELCVSTAERPTSS